MKGNTHHPRFPEVLHQLLKDAEADGNEHIVPWLPCGRHFKVHNTSVFATAVMPKYFNHNLFKSFLRQLSLYKFRRGSWKPSILSKESPRPPLWCDPSKNRKMNKSAWAMCDGDDADIHHCQSLNSANYSSFSAQTKKKNSKDLLVETSDHTSSSSSSSSSLTIFETHLCLSPQDIVQEIIQTFSAYHTSKE